MVNGIGKNVLILGIGGISLSAIAEILKCSGHNVVGYDKTQNEGTSKLEGLGFDICYAEKNIKLDNVDTIIYTSAISEDFGCLELARERKIKTLGRADALRLISEEFNRVVAISGSHGKTTATAIISTILELGCDNFTAHVGGEMVEFDKNLLIRGNKDIFVTEACEYKRNFLLLRPNISVILNMDLDHTDVYGNQQSMLDAYLEFSNNIKENGTLIINLDCVGAEELIKKTKENKKIITYSISNRLADYYIDSYENVENLKFSVCNKREKIGSFSLNSYFEHNLYNALASIIVSRLLGVELKDIKAGINKFHGVKRRFEQVGEINGAKVILDYAHHPQELKNVILSAKSHTKGKVFAIFQPHTFSRTKYFWSEFIKSLSFADNVIMYPIYPAREKTIIGVSSKRMAEDLRRLNKKCYYNENMNEIRSYLGYFVTNADLVLVLGAGNIDKFRDLVK